MAFNIKPFFNLNKMSTSVFERDMGDDPVFARTPKKSRACGSCCDKYSNGKYDAKYEFILKREKDLVV